MDFPDQVQVNAIVGEQVTVLELRVHPEDLGKVIGRQGRTAKSIRTLLGAAGMKLKKRFTLEISSSNRNDCTKVGHAPVVEHHGSARPAPAWPSW